uniref:Uncharacterized protein n=1 Tax=viral metagenome TaxID=1070528 RepID=A0A6M3KCK9_9ZZZZ
MNYELSISDQNRQAHIDIENDIQKQGNGLFTFIIRVNNGNIVDYNVVEYTNASKYLVLKKIVIEEFIVVEKRKLSF